MAASSLPELLAIMAKLRQDCPWDKAQTPQSLSRYAIEEAYEVESAIQSGDAAHVREELGDLLLQVVFQAQMYQEAGCFDFDDVVTTLSAKLIRRHPHVFDDAQSQVTNAADVAVVWEQIKQQEQSGTPQSWLSTIKPGPALNQAQALQKQAAKVGFDWADVQGAQDKLAEELEELNEAIDLNDITKIQDELGDCFFSLVNVARKLNINSEAALLGTTHKFRTRFAYIEQQLHATGKSLETTTLADMDALWNMAKTATSQ